MKRRNFYSIICLLMCSFLIIACSKNSITEHTGVILEVGNDVVVLMDDTGEEITIPGNKVYDENDEIVPRSHLCPDMPIVIIIDGDMFQKGKVDIEEWNALHPTV